ncbi:MAG: Lsr2 family protein [Actinomycetota bacterium]|nr:Lsr2 family protein [Actinomycetota bacterium]
MAQKVVREFIDDTHGSAAERTFTFAVDGTAYEIGLSGENIAEFKSAIGGFIESARKVKATSNGRRQRGESATGLRDGGST